MKRRTFFGLFAGLAGALGLSRRSPVVDVDLEKQVGISFSDWTWMEPGSIEESCKYAAANRMLDRQERQVLQQVVDRANRETRFLSRMRQSNGWREGDTIRVKLPQRYRT